MVLRSFRFQQFSWYSVFRGISFKIRLWNQWNVPRDTNYTSWKRPPSIQFGCSVFNEDSQYFLLSKLSCWCQTYDECLFTIFIFSENNRRWRFVPAIDDFQTYQTFSRKASSSGDGNQSMLKQKDMLNVDRICWSKRIPFDLESHQRFRYWDDKQKSVVWTFSSSKLL